MFRMSPGVERVLREVREQAGHGMRPSLRQLAVALLADDDGRPAVLLERAGLSVRELRARLSEMTDDFPLTDERRLLTAAQNWSIAYRRDPEFLTDTLFLAVLRADARFAQATAAIGLHADHLEAILKSLEAKPDDHSAVESHPVPTHDFSLDASGEPTSPLTSEYAIDPPTTVERQWSLSGPQASRGEDHPPCPAPEPRQSTGQPNGDAAETPEDRSLCSAPECPAPEMVGGPPPSDRIASGAEPTEWLQTARIIDVNLNRAREAARVLEDYCRFVLDDRLLTEEAKLVRHTLAAIAERFPSSSLTAARDTLRDVGTTVTAPGEYLRSGPTTVAVVNCKRLQEALRSLEEYGKLYEPSLGRELEALRYRTYTLERVVSRRAGIRDRLEQARLYLLLGRPRGSADLQATISRAAAGGVDVVQLREKALADRELLSLARQVREWTHRAGVLFIVNDRPDIARLAEADGVHLGQDDLPVKEARSILGPEPLIGVSTHTLEQVRQAVLDGADYLGIGPVFPSRTKSFDEFPGLAFVRAACRATSLPAFALGGITVENLSAVVAAGAVRVAVSSAIVESEQPEEAARLLKAGLPSVAPTRGG